MGRTSVGSRIDRGEAARSVAGSHKSGVVHSGPQRATCRWKASWVGKAGLLDGSTVEATLGRLVLVGIRSRGLGGPVGLRESGLSIGRAPVSQPGAPSGDRGRQRSLANVSRADNARRTRDQQVPDATRSQASGQARRRGSTVCEWTEAERRAVKRATAGVSIAARRSGVVRENQRGEVAVRASGQR